jgi:hypothetical protein
MDIIYDDFKRWWIDVGQTVPPLDKMSQPERDNLELLAFEIWKTAYEKEENENKPE